MSTSQHEVVEFRRCTFGDGGFMCADGAYRVVCRCGWVSAPIQNSKPALVALWEVHRDTSEGTASEEHRFTGLHMCTFGDGGFMYHDGADRAMCSCGWKSAAVQRDKPTLIALWKSHRTTVQAAA